MSTPDSGLLRPEPHPETADEATDAGQVDREQQLLEDRPPHYDR